MRTIARSPSREVHSRVRRSTVPACAAAAISVSISLEPRL